MNVTEKVTSALTRPFRIRSRSSKTLIITFTGAGTAEGAAILGNFAFEIDSFAALDANDAGTFEAGKILG